MPGLGFGYLVSIRRRDVRCKALPCGDGASLRKDAPSHSGPSPPGTDEGRILRPCGRCSVHRDRLTLVVFGYLALFSIGWPFALTGIIMLALIGQRHRVDVLAPALAWPWVFTIGYLLLAPIGCTSSATPTIGDRAVEGVTRCNSLFLTYEGRTPYEPPWLPALLTGVALATTASLAIQWALRRRRTDRRSIGPGVAASSN